MIRYFQPPTFSVLAVFLTLLALGAGNDITSSYAASVNASIVSPLVASAAAEAVAVAIGGGLGTNKRDNEATSESTRAGRGPSEPRAADSNTAGLSRKPSLREVSRWERRRLGLQTIASNAGDTTSASVPLGNPTSSCASSSRFINGCRSLFFTVIGNGDTMAASPCDRSTSFSPEIHVWEGSNCYDFTCGPGTFDLNVVSVAALLTWPLNLTHSAHVVTLRGSCTPAGGRTVPQVLWSSVLGVKYHIQVTGETAADAGNFTLDIAGRGSAIPVVPFDNGAYQLHG